jgi:hypothetical protein
MIRFFRVTPPSVHQMMLSLERAGLISRKPGAPRSIVVLLERLVAHQLECAEHESNSDHPTTERAKC